MRGRRMSVPYRGGSWRLDSMAPHRKSRHVGYAYGLLGGAKKCLFCSWRYRHTRSALGSSLWGTKHFGFSAWENRGLHRAAWTDGPWPAWCEHGDEKLASVYFSLQLNPECISLLLRTKPSCEGPLADYALWSAWRKLHGGIRLHESGHCWDLLFVLDRNLNTSLLSFMVKKYLIGRIWCLHYLVPVRLTMVVPAWRA